MNTRRDEFIAEVTAGLKGDPELRRDVSAEIGSHLDDATETAISEGHSEEESLDAALKSFGSPVVLAGDLADANRNRMRLRAWLRILVGAAVVPAAVVLAVWMVVTAVERVSAFAFVFGMFSADTLPSSLFANERVVARWNLSQQDRVIVFGDRSKATRTDQQRALCNLEPTNRAFYANYIRCRLTDYSSKKDGLTDVLKDLQGGERLDPDNAYYDYLVAGVMVENAGEWVSKGKGTNTVQVYVVKDTNLLEQAMTEFQRGVDKPFHRTHAGDLLSLRRSLLPPSERMEEEMLKIGMGAGVLLPQITIYRNLARVSKEYGAMLIEEGHPDQAVKVLNRILPFSEHLTQDSWCLIEVLVASAIADIGRKGAVPLLEKAGYMEAATKMQRKADAFVAPVAKWKTKVRKDHGVDPVLRNKASVLVGMLLPGIGDQDIVTEAELVPGRHIDQVILEQSTVMVLILFFLVLMLFTGLLALRWRRARGSESAPFLILPDWRQAAVIMGVSIVLPVALYIFYTRFSGLAGREMSLAWNGQRFIAELAVLGIFMVVCSVWLSLRHVRRRCRALGVPVPATLWKETKAWVAVWRSDYSLYLGTAARSLIPVYAVAILLLGGAVQPWLAHEETRWLRADPLILQGNNIGGFTSIETRLVTRLKKEILEGARRGEP